MKYQAFRPSLHPQGLRATASCWLRCALFPVLYLFCAPLVLGAGYPDSGGRLEWLTFPQVTVASDGDTYTGLVYPEIGFGWTARIDIPAHPNKTVNIKSWEAFPIVSVEGVHPDLHFGNHNVEESYPFGNRPRSKKKAISRTFPASFLDEFVTEACNARLGQLIEAGSTKGQVLRQNQTITMTVWGIVNVEWTPGWALWGGPKKFAPLQEQVQVVCQKSPAAGIKPGVTGVTSTADFELDNATLTIYPYTYIGPCPKELTLFMQVQGSHAGTFEARIQSTAGWKSTKVVLQTNEFDDNSGLWSREFSDPFVVPVQPPVPGGGGGAVGQQGPANFQLEQPPGDGYEPPTTGPMAAADGFAPTEPGSNVHQQSLQLCATANDKTVCSPWQQYRVTCDAKPALEPATQVFLPGGDGPEPPKPGTPTPSAPNNPTPSGPAPQAPGKEPTRPMVNPAPEKPAPARDTKSTSKSAPSRPAPTGNPPVTSKPALNAPQPTTKSVDLLVVQARRNARNPNVIEFLVENAGPGRAAPSSAQLTCAKAGNRFETWIASVPAIEASDRVWIETTPQQARPVRTGVRGCEIRLDHSNRVKETNERNNTYSCTACAEGAARKR